MTQKPREDSAQEATITLTRKQAQDILCYQMGWEGIDLVTFWRLAKAVSDKGVQS